jgi:glutaminase
VPWDKIIGAHNRFAGEELTVPEDIYKVEAETNFRNRGIAHILFNSGNLHGEPLEATDVYPKRCSVGVTCNQLAVMGGTLANNGVNPVTKERCLEAKYVPGILCVVTMAGLCDSSGAWAWNAGLPAKTGVGGGIVAVVPGRIARPHPKAAWRSASRRGPISLAAALPRRRSTRASCRFRAPR